MNILLFQRTIPSYRVKVFEQLYSCCNVVVCHSSVTIEGVESYAADMTTPNEIIPGYYLATSKKKLFNQSIIPSLWAYKPEIIIGEYLLGLLTFGLLFFLNHFLDISLLAGRTL